uniref:Rho-GAP domain-containing protein n=1 Tax=Acrobeloides nanus TaxID=290746 RepID=A0A914CJM6_9BILA
MKSPEQSEKTYWKGKLTVPRSISSPLLTDIRSIDSHNFAVGYFPSNCVELFGDKPLSPGKERVDSSNQKWHRHRSLLRSLFRSTAKINSTANENKKVFGVDLTEYLSKSQLDVPLVLTKCIEVIETHGVVTGIYRQCGIQSNIRQLRWEFDSGIVPNFSAPIILQDIHCVSSLLKQYFRQLPNPLFTSDLYMDLLEAFGSRPIERITNVREVIKRLPSAHYRTAKQLMHHLNRMSKKRDLTDMNASNLAIVWAPNLFRNPPSLDTTTMILTGINVHKNLCNFLIVHAYSIFEDIPETFDTSIILPDIDASSDDREDSDSRTENHKDNNHFPVDRNCIEVNGGPATLPQVFHTVLPRRSLTDNPEIAAVKLRKKIWRNSTMESSLLGFLHRRGIIMNQENEDENGNNEKPQHQKRKWSNISDPSHKRSEIHRSESILANFAKNVEDFRDTVVRTVRNRVRSVRRGHKSRKNSFLETASVIERVDSFKLANGRFERFSTSDFPTSPRLMSKSMEAHEMFEPNECPAPKIPPHAKMEDMPRTPSSVRSLKQENLKPPVTPSPLFRRRRVMFESNSPAKEVIYEIEQSSKEQELSTTDASSAESLPLDVSRYDNVSPQKSIDTEEDDAQPRVNSTPLSFYEDPNLLVVPKTPETNPN